VFVQKRVLYVYRVELYVLFGFVALPDTNKDDDDSLTFPGHLEAHILNLFLPRDE